MRGDACGPGISEHQESADRMWRRNVELRRRQNKYADNIRSSQERRNQPVECPRERSSRIRGDAFGIDPSWILRV